MWKSIQANWFSNLRGDVLSGLVVALALIPEAIAFSIIALQNGYKKDMNTLANRYKKKYPNAYFHLEL